MAYVSATFSSAPPLVGRVFAFPACRQVVGRAAMGLGTVVAAVSVAALAAVGGVWIVTTALSGNPKIHARAPIGPATLALVNEHPYRARAASAFSAASIWNVAAYAPHISRAVARMSMTRVAELSRTVPPIPAPVASVPHMSLPTIKRLAYASERLAHMPLPQLPPTMPAMALAAAELAAPETVASIPAAAITERRALSRHATDKPISVPTLGSRTAVYDIEAHTVYMPNGERLEAHSGLGSKLDDPRYIKVKARGPTPPNVYRLTLREQLFHGVRAIRLNPVDDSKMFGRDGMLAHTYMLGPSGQSNGCVSFKDYQKFLTAFLEGKVDRLVVVSNHGAALARASYPTRASYSRESERYAFNVQ